MFPRLHTLNLETAEGAAPFAGGYESEPAEPTEPEVEYAQIPADEWQQYQEDLAWLGEARRLAADEQFEPEQPLASQNGVPDPYDDPEGYLAAVRDAAAQAVAPVTHFQQQLEEQEGRERGFDILADLESREGEFLLPDYSRQRAYDLADGYYSEAVQRYGDTSKAAEAALERGYKEAREHELAIGKAYHDREINQLSTLSGAPREPAAAGTIGAQQLVTEPGGDETDIVRARFQRR